MRTAVITGITGQDGSYLAELLLGKNYNVVGITRRSSTPNTERISHLLCNPRLKLEQADLTDSVSIANVFTKLNHDDRIEVYNLAAQSHVATSFQQPEYTTNVDGLGPLRILEVIRKHLLASNVRFYQASTSELFGKVQETPQRESTPFYPRSPYGVSKLYAHWIVKNYRESYGMFACSGILFNHESERRGKDFITRKITSSMSKIYTSNETLELGNIDAKRDWGHAEDYVYGMWLMLQQDVPNDFVLATGESHSVREFVELAFKEAGHVIMWRGVGLDEVGVDESGRIVIKINPSFYRPSEVDALVGDASLARESLGWIPRVTFKELVGRMVRADA
jgi:GDPmannose 4,6-dehydratase